MASNLVIHPQILIFSMFKISAVFKAPQHPQLRVGRRPCKGPRVNTKILKKI